MKRKLNVGIAAICLFTTTLHAQDSSSRGDQLRINELSDEATKLKAQLKQKTDEIERIRNEHPDEHLTVPNAEVSPTAATPTLQKEPLDQLAEILKIRQTLKDPALAELPGKLSYVHPATGSDTIAIDAGLDLNVLRAMGITSEIVETTKVDAFAEYHRNNSTSSPVDTLLIGSQFKHNLGEFLINPKIGLWGNWLGGDASFKQDDIVSGKGFLGEIFYYPYNKKLGIGSNQSPLPIIEYSINPNIGFQYETGNGASAKFTSGDRVSFKTAVNLTIDPLPILLDHRLEWSNTINFWSHMSTTGGFDQYERNQYFFQSSLNLYFDHAKQVAVGIDYIYGDNLTTNQFDTDTWTISFKAKLGK